MRGSNYVQNRGVGGICPNLMQKEVPGEFSLLGRGLEGCVEFGQWGKIATKLRGTHMGLACAGQRCTGELAVCRVKCRLAHVGQTYMRARSVHREVYTHEDLHTKTRAHVSELHHTYIRGSIMVWYR